MIILIWPQQGTSELDRKHLPEAGEGPGGAGDVPEGTERVHGPLAARLLQGV